jgi:hypothetical protein
MKIAEQTSSRLVLAGRNSGILLILLGIIFGGIGIVTMYAFGQTVALSCSRDWQPDPCRIERTWLSIPVKTTSLHSLLESYLDESSDSDGTSYRVMLVTQEGNVPLTSSYSSNYSQQLNIVREINAFLGNREQRTLEVESSGTFSLVFGLVFVFVGVGVLYAGIRAFNLLWIFDREVGVLMKVRNGNAEAEYPLSTISGVHVGVSRDSDGADTYRVELSLQTGERVPLTSFYSSGRRGKVRAAQAIRDFLAVGESQPNHSLDQRYWTS